MTSDHLLLAQKISAQFSTLPQVQAIALSGSLGSGSGAADGASDIDLYVYTNQDISIEKRREIMETSGGAIQSNLGLNYWGPGDEWFNAATGMEVDMVYFDADWMDDQISRVTEKHQASLGYTTCFWHTIRQSILLFDQCGWFVRLQERCQQEYPEPLRQNIVALNYPVLREIIPSYAHQIEKAVKRGDIVSINHRTTALFASYFDIILAANHQLHPGEKRLIEFLKKNCRALPENMESDIASILCLPASEIRELPGRITSLLDHLDQMLIHAGFSLAGCQP